MTKARRCGERQPAASRQRVPCSHPHASTDSMSAYSGPRLRTLACTCSPRRPPQSRVLARQLHLDSASPSSAPAPPLTAAQKGKGVDRWPGWTAVIGLELHVQLRGNVKLLSGASHRRASCLHRLTSNGCIRCKSSVRGRSKLARRSIRRCTARLAPRASRPRAAATPATADRLCRRSAHSQSGSL